MQQVAARIVAYLALFALVLASVALTSLELGGLRIAGHYGIAAMQVVLIFLVFMQLRSAAPLVRIMAGGSVLWLLIMFGFTLLDYANR